jgi:hypothetical protein
MVGGEALAHDAERGGDGAHGGEELGVAFVAHQAADGGDDDVGVRDGEFGTDAGAGDGVRAEDGGVAAVEDGDGVGGDVEAPCVCGFLGGDGGEDVGDPAGGQLHGQAGGAAGPGRGLVEQESVAGIGDMRHAGGLRGHAGEEAADRHVGVDEVRFFGAEQGEKGAVGADLGSGREAAREGRGFDAEALAADIRQQGAVRADADHGMAAGAGAAHEGQQEVAEGEIDVGDFDDFHVGR